MLHDLQIQNFKCWKNTGDIRLAPITLFFGTNSSGKSSISQFLMMLKQTVESSDRKAVFYPGGSKSAVQMGSFQEMVYRRDVDNNIYFKYKWDLAKDLEIKDAVTESKYNANQICFDAQASMDLERGQDVYIESLNYDLYDTKEDGKHVLSIEMKKENEKKLEYKVDARNYSLKRNVGRVWKPGPPVRFYGFPDEINAYYQNAEFVQDLNLVHENLFKSIYYLGPLREESKRLYPWPGITPESVGFKGENTIPAMLASKGRNISLGKKRAYRALEHVVAESLKTIGLIDNFEVKRISKSRQEYEVKVRTTASMHWVDLPDVGVGVSQVLPVLVQCFYAPHDSIIIMEQPEIHLHPSAQAALADVIIDVINSKEDGKDRNIQLIIETHSEHFLRRLQRRIAEGKIEKEKVAAYFASLSKTEAELRPLEIDLFGNIENWPDNFFGDDMGDIIAQSKAAILKQMKHTS